MILQSTHMSSCRKLVHGSLYYEDLNVRYEPGGNDDTTDRKERVGIGSNVNKHGS